MNELKTILAGLSSSETSKHEMKSYTNGNFSCEISVNGVSDVDAYLKEKLKYRGPRQNTAYMRKETETSKILGAINRNRSLLAPVMKLMKVDFRNFKDVKKIDAFKEKLAAIGLPFSPYDIEYALSIIPQAWRQAL